MGKLKPCPFCGADAFLQCTNGRYGWFVYAKCELCGAESKNRKFDGDKPDDELWDQPEVEQAIRDWNRRTG